MKNIQSIQNSAINKLNSDREGLERLLKDYHGNPVTDFIIRVLEWYNNKDKSQLLWEFTHKAFDMNPLLFMGSFGSFVGNCLLDDSSFKIEWRKPDLNGYSLKWLPNGEFQTIVTTKDDPKGKPLLVWSGDDDGETDVALIMEAMDILEEREKIRAAKFKEIEND